MARQSGIWFRTDSGWWMTTLRGERIRLAQGRDNKKLAEQKFHELMATRAEAPESANARVADVIEAFLVWSVKQLSDETHRNYKWFGQLFAEHAGLVRVAELKPFHVSRWVDSRKWGKTTERNARRSIYRVFSWACEEGILAKNPLHGMKSPAAAVRSRIMSDEEFRALLKNTDPPFRRFLFALQQTGARPKELRLVRWDQVLPDRLVLGKHKTAKKTGKPRVIYLTAAMRKLVAVLRRSGGTPTDFVFLNGRGVGWSASAIKQRAQRLKRKLKLKSDVSLYMLRHAFGTNAVLKGIDVATVAELMGHSDLQMVSRVYVHLAAETAHLADAAEKATGAAPRPTPMLGESRRAV